MAYTHSPLLIGGCKETVDLLTKNPILDRGAIMYEKSSTGHIVGVKIGDGEHRWTELPYIQSDMSELEAYVQKTELKEYQLRKIYEPVYSNEIIYNGGDCANGL